MTTPYTSSDTLGKVSHVIVGGIKTACLSRAELTDLLVKDCLLRQKSDVPPARVFSSNGHAISTAASCPQARADMAQAEIVHADGGIVVFAANRLTQGHIGDRSATTDFFHDMAKAAAENGLSFYLLGGTEEINAKCAEIMQTRYTGLKIVGRHNGYFKPGETDSLCAEISALKPDIVWVGLGKPKEQRFCVENRSKIKAGYLVTCGGCYHYVTGDYPRAPLWMQKSGLEWVHRMITKPRQLFWRYLTTNPHALYLIATRTRRDVIVG